MTAPRILYFAHDLDDTAIWRRVSMLEAGGAEVAILGFRRGSGPLPRADAVVLGTTEDGKMAKRAATVLGLTPVISARLRAAALFGGKAPDVILARNLEMLVLARLARRTITPRPRLVYELLDIHRLQAQAGAPGRIIRTVERSTIRACDQVIVSSPGFVRNYLEPWNMAAKDTLLLENKVFLQSDTALPAATDGPARVGPVEDGRVTIGWFGILRCAWSLDTLDRLSQSRPGQFRIVLRGKPALDKIPDFHDRVAANPDIHFGGAYHWPDDLPEIYGAIDIAWLIDRFDADGNSRWLLPNRLYEGCLFGSAPVVIAPSEVGAKLASLGCGIILPDDTWDDVEKVIGGLTADDVARERSRVADLPQSLWRTDTSDCADLVRQLTGPEMDAALV